MKIPNINEWVLNFENITLYSENSIEYKEFHYFCETLLQQNTQSLNEGIGDFFKSIPSKLKIAWDFIKEFGSVLGDNIKEFIKALQNNYVFSFLKHVGFSLRKIFDFLKAAYKTFIDLRDKMFEHFVNLNPHNTKEVIQKFDSFLSKYPILKKIAGVGLAYLLYYIWCNAISFTGDPEFDFNISDIWNALVGKLGFADVFGGTNGAKMISFILLNHLTGISFPWGSFINASFYFAIAYTLIKATGQKIKWKKQSEFKD